MTTRTQDEILARFHAADDFFGFAIEVLSESMTADTIRQINSDAELPGDWTPQTIEQVEASAREYLTFAVDKALSHRGISAERSVIKLREFAWLLGRDDVVTAMDEAEYPQYGMPKVKAFALGLGWVFGPTDVDELEALDRMSSGDECRPGCDEGCGQ